MSRIVGLTFFALGASLWARVGWFGFCYGWSWNFLEWMQFGSWLWASVVLILVGVVVRQPRESIASRRSRSVLSWLIFLFLLVSGFKYALDHGLKKPGSPHPSSSSLEAKRKGVWVRDCSFEPSSFQFDHTGTDSALFAGDEFLSVTDLHPGEQVNFECDVEFRKWMPGITTQLGKSVIREIP